MVIATAADAVQQLLQFTDDLGIDFHFDFALAPDQQTEFRIRGRRERVLEIRQRFDAELALPASHRGYSRKEFGLASVASLRYTITGEGRGKYLAPIREFPGVFRRAGIHYIEASAVACATFWKGLDHGEGQQLAGKRQAEGESQGAGKESRQEKVSRPRRGG